MQFATDIRTEREYAIKFFATRDAFIDEAALYSDSQNPLNKLLPRVREICDNVDGRVTDAVGEALPPCIIMEKGEALNIWSRRNKGGLDHMTALQVSGLWLRTAVMCVDVVSELLYEVPEN